MSDLLAPEEFYDALADEYESMTGVASRVERAVRTLEPLVRGLSVARAADMGCGTGTHTLALARLGVSVTAGDVSTGMLRAARTRCAGAIPAPRFLHGDFRDDAFEGDAPYDAVFCLGNGIAHVASDADLAAVFARWRAWLAPDGAVVAQLLNYDRIRAAGERIAAARSDDAGAVVRFYDFAEPRWIFHVLAVRRGESNGGWTLRSTPLTPFGRADLERAAREAGFASAAISSTADGAPWTPASRDTWAVLR